MDNAGEDPTTIEFKTSTSQIAKVRVWMWLVLVSSFVVSILQNGWTLGVFWAVGTVGFIMGVLDWKYFRKAVVAKAVVSVDGKGISAPNFSTKTKWFSWADIGDVSIQLKSGVRILELMLKPHLQRKDKRGFVSGINEARPYININGLAPVDQERLFDEVARRIRGEADGAVGASPPDNLLAEERLFRESLVALAPRTWVTWGLVAVNVAIWLALGLSGANIIKIPADVLLVWGGNAASAVQQGQWWRLATAIFLHGGAIHLLMNMLGLVALGQTAERMYGHRLFMMIYLGAGLVGSAASVHFGAQKAVSVGASGAIYGIAGVLLVSAYRYRSRLPRLTGKNAMRGSAFFILYSLVQGLVSPGIDNAAHIGGLLSGMALAFILPARIDLAQYARTVRSRTLAAAAFLAVVVTCIAVSAPPAAVDQRARSRAEGELSRAFKAFSVLISDLQRDATDVKAGKITEITLDEKGRTHYAPRMQRIHDDLRGVRLPPEHPLAQVATDMTRLTLILQESLAMQSNVVDGKPVPVNPARFKAIEDEAKQLDKRIATQAKAIMKSGEKS